MRVVLLALALLSPVPHASAGPLVADGFEAPRLDETIWLPKDVRYGDGVPDPQLTLTTEDSRCGLGAARVRLTAADGGRM